jgi:hypothetical protein
MRRALRRFHGSAGPESVKGMNRMMFDLCVVNYRLRRVAISLSG